MELIRSETERGRVAYSLQVPRAGVTVRVPWVDGWAALDDNDDNDLVVVHDNEDLPVLCINTGVADRIVPSVGEWSLEINDGEVVHAFQMVYEGRNLLTISAQGS